MLIQHTLRYLPAQLFAPLAQLLSVVLWTHALAPAQMGVFTLVTVAQEVAYLVCLSWFSVYSLRYLPPQADGPARQRFLATENTVMLASSAGAMLAAGVTTAGLPPQEASLQTAVWVAAYFVTRAASTHYAERARAQSAFLAYTVLQTAGPVGGLVLGWAALQTLRADATTLLAAYALAQALGIGLAVSGLGMRWSLERPDKGLLAAAARFGAPMIGLGVLSWLAENYIRYQVQWQEGAATLGLMIVGWALGRRCASVASMLVATAAFPLASRLLNEGRRAEALTQLRVNAALLLAVLVPVTVAVELLGAPLVALAVAEPYRDITTELLGLSVFAAALRNLHVHVTDQLMVLDRRFGMAAGISSFETLACTAASMGGLALGGVQAAVAGQALGSALALLASLHLARTRLGFVWPSAETLKILAATASMAVVLHAWEPAATVWGLVGAALIGATSYFAALAALFKAELRRSITHWRRARHKAA